MGREDFASFPEADAIFRNSKGKEKPAPELPSGVRLADTHCHLGMIERPGLAIARAAHHGFRFLECVLDPAAPPEEGDRPAVECLREEEAWLADAREILDGWGEEATPLPRLRYAVGVHPHNAKDCEAVSDVFRELLCDPRVSCVGEIGLDYHYDLSPREDQREVFARQLRLARELELPVELHLREAHDEALAIMRREGVPEAGCIVHCFNLGRETLAPFLELGCHIAFGGPLTFRKSYYTRDACLMVPPGRLLTETDAPYMAPEPLRGVACEPAHALYTMRMLLDCFGYAGEERAVEALSPRPVDVENGARPLELGSVDFSALQGGMDEAAFCERVFENAVSLLDRKPRGWQRP